MFPKKPRVAFTVLEWRSHSNVESNITTEFGMYNREMFFPVTEHRIDSFHAAVKTQDKEVQIQPQAQPVGHCYLLIEFVEFKFAARLIFVITQCPNVTRIHKDCSSEFPEKTCTVLDTRIQLNIPRLIHEISVTGKNART